MQNDIEVFYLTNSGERTTDVVNGQPCVNLYIGYDEDCAAKRIRHPRETIPVVGLIDTGAQGIVCDDGIIARLNSYTTRSTETRSANGIHITYGWASQIHFPEIPWTIRAEVFSSPLRAQGHPYDILIGRDLLSWCTFTWSDLKGIERLAFSSHPPFA